jgi:hypothetical protein
MEQYWAESRSSPFPESIRSAIADLRLAVERREIDAAWDAAVQVCVVHAAELEEQREGGLEEENARKEGDQTEDEKVEAETREDEEVVHEVHAVN